MNIYFYSSHTLYAKVLLPLIIVLINAGHKVYVSENKFSFLKYDPARYAGSPVLNTFVNKSSFDFAAGVIGFGKEWNEVKGRVKFSLFYKPKKGDTLIGTTKDLERLRNLKKRYPQNNIFAVGYQHMPFTISVNGRFRSKSLPRICREVFMEPNPFSDAHRFREYISESEVSFRGFPYLEKIYNLRELTDVNKEKRYCLIFHPGGYRDVITKRGDTKKTSYENQKKFLKDVCGPVLEAGLIPVVKIHPLSARFHLKADVADIVSQLSRDRQDFSRVLVEDRNYYKYIFETRAIVCFGSSAIYELFSIGAENVLICNFFGSSRSRKFSFLRGIFLDRPEDYRNYWKASGRAYFRDAYRENALLDKIYRSYSGLFAPDISEKILQDTGLI